MTREDLWVSGRTGFTTDGSLHQKNLRQIEDYINNVILEEELGEGSIEDLQILSVSVSKLISGTMTANAILGTGGMIRTGAAGDRRVEYDADGIRLIDDDGTVLVSIPTDPASTPYFSGGSVSSVGVGETLAVEDSPNPTAAPVVTSSVSSTGFVGQLGEVFGTYYSRRALWYDSTETAYRYVYYGSGFGDTVLVTTNTAGTYVAAWVLTGPTSIITSMVYIAGSDKWYAYHAPSGYLYVFNSTDVGGTEQPTGGIAGAQLIHGGGGGLINLPGFLATDGTDLFFAEPQSDGTVDIKRYTVSGTTASLAATVTCDPGEGAASVARITAFYRGSGDLGATRNIFQYDQGQTYNSIFTAGHYYVFDSTGTRQTSEEWDSEAGGGLTYRGGTFYELSPADDIIYSYGPATSFDAEPYWAAYTWYDSDATGGTHESSLSPRSGVTGAGRRSLSVTWPTIPDAGGTDDPDRVRLYLKKNATDPGSTFGDYFRQGSTYSGTNTTLTTYDTGTAGAQDTAFGASGAPGEIVTDSGGFELRGDGTLILPTFNAPPGSPTQAQVYYDTSDDITYVWDGAAWQPLYP